MIDQMSDKNLDKDGILGNNDDVLDDISFKSYKPKKSSVSTDEIDELIASYKKKKLDLAKKVKTDIPVEENDTDETPVTVETAVTEVTEDTDETVKVVPAVIEDISEDEDEGEEEEEVTDIAVVKNDKPVIGSDENDLKKHFGKDHTEDDDEDEEEDEEDDDDEEEKPAPVKKSSDKQKAAENNVKKPANGKKKKKKKRGGIGFNGSIFGGIILVTIILTVSMLLAVGGLTLGMEYYGIGKDENTISFNIPEGSSNEEIADLLFENGIIKNKDLFLMAVKIMKPKTIYPGDITLKPSMTYSDIIEEMEKQRKRYETVTITFYEGEYLIDIAAKLEENKVCSADEFLFEFKKNMDYKFEKYITDNENAFYSREGYCFPDTYEFYVGDTAYNITKILREHFDSKITDDMYKKMNDMGLTLNETMTLASIVQKEAASTEEMPKVASVFLNRLNDPDTFPMLQSDTTYKYIDQVIKKKAANEGLVEHYIEYYDTYAIDGLPAGPICNPGIEAIKAVLNAEKTNYYYFCNNTETGETFYAETLEEHEKNLVKAGLAEAVTEDDENEEENGEGEDEGEENNEEYYETW